MATPIVALDVPELGRALDLVRSLGDTCGFYKVGSELFVAEGPRAVEEVRALGKRVFLDLKLHDIPNTVGAAAASAARLGASLLTVHATGGEAALRAAVAGAREDCGILAVTVLTSLDAAALGGAWGRAEVSVSDEVERLARIAAAAGAHGIVCSGHEAKRVRAAFGGALRILVPGVRFAGGAAHDQSRVVTVGGAVEAGADYLVLGRAVTAAADPADAMRMAVAQLEEAAAPG
jgi:orotidine-5'-phosphate decarboxylase